MQRIVVLPATCPVESTKPAEVAEPGAEKGGGDAPGEVVGGERAEDVVEGGAAGRE